MVLSMCTQYNDKVSLYIFSWYVLGLCLPFSVSQQVVVHSHPGIDLFTQVVSSYETCLVHQYHSSKWMIAILVLSWILTNSFMSFLPVIDTFVGILFSCILKDKVQSMAAVEHHCKIALYRFLGFIMYLPIIGHFHGRIIIFYI